MTSMGLSVEFLLGTSALEAVTEAKEKAKFLNVAYITFRLNKTSFNIGPCADIEKAVKQYPKSKYIYEF